MRAILVVNAIFIGLVAACSPGDPATAAASPAAAPAPATPSRIVAVGDLHGDLDNALAALALTGVVDAEGHWIGGTTTLVQTGDTTDRGPDSRAVMELIDGLEEQAEAAGGRVIALLGNHEVMNLTGDWRYVHPGDLEAFGGPEARRAAFTDGTPGRWLRALPVAARVEDTVFVHGGITPEVAALGLDTINARVHESLRTGRQDALLGSEGPLWYRGYVQDPEDQACPRLARALESLGARRMVVGHTTRRDGAVQSRCDGRLHVIDIGISDAYGGNLGAWIGSGGDARAVYPDRTVDLEDPS